MKRIICALAVFLAAGISACNALKEALLPAFDFTLPTFQFTIAPIPIVPTEEMALGSFSMYFNLDSIVKANTGGVFGAQAVSTVKVKEMRIDLSNADAANNLANFRSARCMLSSNAEGSPVEIASFNFVDSAASSLAVQPQNGAELRPYLMGNQLEFSILGRVRRPTTKTLNVGIAVTISAK